MARNGSTYTGHEIAWETSKCPFSKTAQRHAPWNPRMDIFKLNAAASALKRFATVKTV